MSENPNVEGSQVGQWSASSFVLVIRLLHLASFFVVILQDTFISSHSNKFPFSVLYIYIYIDRLKTSLKVGKIAWKFNDRVNVRLRL